MSVELSTIDEAFQHFMARVVGNVMQFDTHKQWPQTGVEDDDALAAFITAHPGVFEERLIASIGMLTAAGWPGEGGRRETALRALVRMPVPDPENKVRTSVVDTTFRAMATWAGLRLCSLSFWHQGPPDPRNYHDMYSLFVYLRDRFRLDSAQGRPMADRITPEMRDVLHWDGRDTQADILPADIEGMSPDDIEAAILEYVGAPRENLMAWLSPGGASAGGFLAPGERLGEVIWQDAKTLRELGIDRHTLADRISELVKSYETTLEQRIEAPNVVWGVDRPEDLEVKRAYAEARSAYRYEDEAPLSVTARNFMGTQEDPFHAYRSNQSGQDFRIQNLDMGDDGVLEGGMLTTTLIRRLCFFEGNVPRRVDPARAARILGLLK